MARSTVGLRGLARMVAIRRGMALRYAACHDDGGGRHAMTLGGAACHDVRVGGMP
jgi:hypothetical protein